MYHKKKRLEQGQKMCQHIGIEPFDVLLYSVQSRGKIVHHNNNPLGQPKKKAISSAMALENCEFNCTLQWGILSGPCKSFLTYETKI